MTNPTLIVIRLTAAGVNYYLMSKDFSLTSVKLSAYTASGFTPHAGLTRERNYHPVEEASWITALDLISIFVAIPHPARFKAFSVLQSNIRTALFNEHIAVSGRQKRPYELVTLRTASTLN